MRRLAIFCDGTWNKLSAPNPTNVVIGSRSVLSLAPDGTQQITYYNEGVGTTYVIHEGLESAFAGAFGRGLFDKIADAYRFLMFNYTAGDEIYIFGFSRGAFTARSLAGMIRKCGILRKEHVGDIGRAFTFYKNADIRPDRPEAIDFRRQYSGDQQRDSSNPNQIPSAIKYVGVWDTVGALGIPSYLRLADLLGTSRRYRFHDHDLSSTVEYARHALALDEDRKAFKDTRWKNLDKLNALPGRTGHYDQKWFPGDHGSVGGGGDVRGLSNAALIWIMEGAEQAGLALDQSVLDGYRAARDFLAPLRNVSASPGLWARLKDAVLFPKEPRTGPELADDLSESTRQRLTYETKSEDWQKYRPASIDPLLRQMFPQEYRNQRPIAAGRSPAPQGR